LSTETRSEIQPQTRSTLGYEYEYPFQPRSRILRKILG